MPRRGLPIRKNRVQKPSQPFDSKRFLATSGPGRAFQDYRLKQIVYGQGDEADAVFVVQTGWVRLSVLSTQGKQATVGLLGPADFLGEGCLALDQPLRLATATAITACSILKINKKEMQFALHEQHQLSNLLVAYLVERHSQVQADLVDQMLNSSEKRLARTLLILVRFGRNGEHEAVMPHISQELLAEMVGTTRSRVNFFMNKFRRLGLIHYNGGLQVNSSLLRRSILEQ